jgi:CNT family concentrative nucleoside transporter
MSAPAAFVIAKVVLPETEDPQTRGTVKLEVEKTTTNVLDAAAAGTADGLRLFLNVMAMLIAFVSIVALIDWPLGNVSVAGEPLSLNRIFGWAFAPVAALMGVPWDDCRQFGSLLGTKVAVNEFLAFDQLSKLGPDMSEKARKMGAYALCGFANFASIGIQIGGIGPLAPERRKDLAKLALRAMLGGAMASWMTATIAGAFIP